MQSVLHSLFNGKIIPWERREPRSQAHLAVVRKIECEERYFIEKMSATDCQRFEALSNLYSEMVSSEEENIFSYGGYTGYAAYAGRDEAIGIPLQRINCWPA